MLLTVGFAFLAGVITVLSPCVLPLLPVIFATAAQGGKARPAGVMLGFIGSFTLATLTLSYLVRSLGLSPDLNRVLASAILVTFGLVLVVPALHRAFERLASGLLAKLPTPGRNSQDDQGFAGGVTVGAGLGLAWSPCVGPIMASVITLALNQQVNAGAVVITLAFALGTAIPMAAVMIGGRKLVGRLRWFQTHGARLQQVQGAVLALSGIAIFLGADRVIQVALLEWFPGWESILTGWEPHSVKP